MPMMPSALEEAEVSNVFTSLVNPTGITIVPCSPTAKPLKTITDVKTALQQGRKQDLKYILRNNAWPVDHPIRNQLWPLLCMQHQNEKSSNSIEGFYWEMVKQVFGTMELPDKPINLPPFVEPSHCHSYYLTHKGRAAVDRVVSVLGYAYPDIVYSPTIYSICALLLHFISEEECYNCMVCLVVCKEKTFITQTKLLYEVTWKTVMQISKKHVVGALRRRENWRNSMFCFLFWLQKGPAVFLQRHCNSARAERIYVDWIWWIFQGLPFQHLIRIMDCFFHEGIKVFYRTAMAILILFYKNSSAPTSEYQAEIQKNGVESALLKFCKEMPVTPQKFLKVAFGIRGLSSAYISRVFIRTEMVLKSKTVISGSRQLVRSRSSENLPNSQSQNNIQMVSHTLTIREGAHSPGPRTLSMGIFPVQNVESVILAQEDVFGAYCSSRWCERNQKDQRGNRQAYFGTGETFLFSLYPERAKYPWVGIDADRVEHGAELFMAADTKMITIGGGDGQAIWIDENIRFGKSDACSTFNNPPLCPGGDFEIRVLEVYGFKMND
ncbi:GTPase-activating protein skywalker isoform X8 [Coccinella septempunctata]|uniref:GTPase-activating protein skywalker isoform X8 n=1 Tax=Coccinella septempunctata TaxID=41139 RepID=UPI001D065DAB|nr:GTPase-activating protein skywalker isoform X8 [Coccinella septempunctata]